MMSAAQSDTLAEPRTQAEFERRYHASAQMDGVGIAGTMMHVPCPFCAAPDWIVHKLVDTQRAYRKGAVCNQCLRSAHAVCDSVQGYTSLRMVQTGGADPAPWVDIERG